ncbi:MAG: hypothetical protein PHX70_13005 [Clostridium sp.]|nr:hypothetical protein [Clostridium sp.]
MISKYCMDCANRQIKSYTPDDFNANPTPHASSYYNNMERKTVPTNPSPGASISDQFNVAPGSPTVLGPQYTQGYLRTLIGNEIKATFLIGTDSLTDRRGILEEVGISYIILRDLVTKVKTVCDIYSIKFVIIY